MVLNFKITKLRIIMRERKPSSLETSYVSELKCCPTFNIIFTTSTFYLILIFFKMY